MSLFKSQLHGLQWVKKTFGLEPRWTLLPDLEVLKRTLQSFKPSSKVKVTFLAQGAFNKLYDVKIDGENLVMRVSLPVDPCYKTLSEVATVNWIRRTTNLSVPTIIRYEPSGDNPVGFEWILMTKLSGKTLAESWRYLPLTAKSNLVRQLATHIACQFRNQLSGIGNIYALPSSIGTSPTVGRIVSMHFFWGDHIYQDIYRGPFRSSKDWITTRLSISEHDCLSVLGKNPVGEDLESDDDDEVEDATRTLEIIRKLRPLLSYVFPVDDQGQEPSIIFHDDLSRNNILVNDNGDLTGVLDWECVSALPLWKACYYPSFLEGRPRHSEPDLGRYHREANGEPSELYWEHLWEYETTLLRQMFIKEMERLEPGWVEVFNTSQVQRDFDIAVQNCDNEFVARHINKWIHDITAGGHNVRSLRDRIDNS